MLKWLKKQWASFVSLFYKKKPEPIVEVLDPEPVVENSSCKKCPSALECAIAKKYDKPIVSTYVPDSEYRSAVPRRSARYVPQRIDDTPIESWIYGMPITHYEMVHVYDAPLSRSYESTPVIEANQCTR